MAGCQKQINLTRKRGGSFESGNHAREREREKHTSRRKNSLPMWRAPWKISHPRAENGRELLGPFELGKGIEFNGTPLLFILLGVTGPLAGRPTWPRLFIKSVPHRRIERRCASCWALTRSVSRRYAIRNETRHSSISK